MRGAMAGVLVLCAAQAWPARAAEPAPPSTVVAAFHAALLDAMQHGTTRSCAQRLQRLDPAVRATFDVPELARLVLRKRWAGLSDGQRQDFTQALEQLIVATYASQFNSFGGESFSAPEPQDLPGGRRRVHTTLVHAPDAPVSFDYILQSSPAGWRVINVLADGISDLALRSAQYESVIRDRGFDALVASLRTQAADYGRSC